MRTSSYSLNKVKQNFEDFFDKASIKKIAKQTGFVTRKIKKIGAFEFVTGLIICFCKKKNTFCEWAEQIGRLAKTKVSKQALFKRTSEKAVLFCKTLLEEAVSKKASVLKNNLIFKSFDRVLLQDSTNFKLPDCLATHFPGNYSKGIQKAVARVQTILDMKTMQFLHFSMSGFTRNDQAASGDIIPVCRKGDLIIRDLGYFVLATFEKVAGSGVHFLSRLRFGVKIYDLEGTEITLKSLFKAGGNIDRQVLTGEKKVPVRLVMLRVPKQIAAAKKRRAKHDRDKRLNHSAQYYTWLEYNVYITTVDDSIWSTEDVIQAYKVRWQIEIIFKSWKSGGLCMQELLHDRCTNAERVKTCICLMLLFVTLFCRKLYLPVLNQMIKQQGAVVISLIKMFTWVCENITDVLALSTTNFIRMVFDKCQYENRNKRHNMVLTVLKCKN